MQGNSLFTPEPSGGQIPRTNHQYGSVCIVPVLYPKHVKDSKSNMCVVHDTLFYKIKAVVLLFFVVLLQKSSASTVKLNSNISMSAE